MHTPDGFITGWICILMLVFSGAVLLFSAWKIRNTLTKEKIVKMSLLGLVIFAAQMLNFPVAEGTSGHLIGAALAAIMLGPYAAVVVLAAVLLLQSLAFGDGGVLALGVNIFNMAIVGSFAAHAVYQRISGRRGVLAASWASVFLASVSASVLLGISGAADLANVLFAMGAVHAVIGMGEALITLAVYEYLFKAASLVSDYVAFTTGLAFLVLALALPFASGEPDGMEKVAINLGFFDSSMVLYEAPFADYLLLGSELAAGLVGMTITFGAIYVSLLLIKSREIRAAEPHRQ
ncbi:cobalamin biosynthesis protein CbiM [Candidatus Micrarchaeota archaeon]|nr:cobalamin biosynthesis protein CbiM [Candidatus Micrarchaeota archaeon]